MCSSRIAASAAARNSGASQVRRILSIASKPVGERESLFILPVQNLRSQRAGGYSGAQCADPEMWAFFIGPNDNLEWMSRGDMTIIESANDLDGTQATDSSIEVTAVGN